MLKLWRLFSRKPKHDLFTPGDQVKFTQRKTKMLMKRIQKKGHA